ncbi:hypothetical protein AB7M35_000029 [Amorphus suaedae]
MKSQPDSQGERDILSIALPFVLCFVFFAYVILVWMLAPANPTSVDQKIAEVFLEFNRPALHPEPRDHFMYVSVAIGLACLAIAAAAAFSVRAKSRINVQAVWAALFVSGIAFAAINGSVLSAIQNAAGSPATILFFVLIVLLCIPIRRTSEISFAVFILGVLAFCAYELAFRIFTTDQITYQAHFFSHYEAVVYSLVQISGGRTCLIDIQPQYGCYPEFISPIIQTFGATPLVITVSFGALFVVSASLILDASRRIITSPAALAALAVWLLFLSAMILFYGSPDPYFAYYPLRVIFPAIAFWLFVRIDADTISPLRICALGAFSAVAMFWNLDSGVAVTLGMAAMVFLGGFTGGKWARPLQRLRTRLAPTLLFFAAVGVGLLLAGFYLLLKSGIEPTLTSLLRYQRLFALSGFAMIPLSGPSEYWVLVMTTFLLVFFVAASAAFKGTERDRALEAAAVLAFMGVGLMLYYFGRSHVFVLRLVAWPSCVLAFFLASRALKTPSALQRTLVAATIGLIAAVPFSFAVRNRAQPEFIYGEMHRRDSPDSIMADVEMIRRFTTPGERVVILGLNSATLYGGTGTLPALAGYSHPERLLKIDMESEIDAIVERGPQKIFVQFGDEPMSKGAFAARLIEPAWLEGQYDLQYSSPTLHYSYLTRKPRPPETSQPD